MFDYHLCNLYSKTALVASFYSFFSIAVDNMTAAKLFSSQNKNSSSERDS